MAYTAGKSKYKKTYDYWDLWNRKNKRVESHFLSKWERQFNEIRKICKDIEIKGEYIGADRFDHEEPYYALYVGTVFNMTPSGKYYMPFASSNVSVKEAAIDEFWRETFEEVVTKEGCWDECGQGDPCDIFICKVAPGRRVKDMTYEDFNRILEKTILPDLTPADYLAIPGIYEILSEYYNNDIIDEYMKEGEDT